MVISESSEIIRWGVVWAAALLCTRGTQMKNYYYFYYCHSSAHSCTATHCTPHYSAHSGPRFSQPNYSGAWFHTSKPERINWAAPINVKVNFSEWDKSFISPFLVGSKI